MKTAQGLSIQEVLSSPWFLASATALLAFAAFSPAIGADFVNWDDDWNFVQNPHYRGFGLAQLKWMFTDTYGHYMPVTWLTLGLDYVLYGMSPGGYHVTSLLFHSATSFALYFVLFILLRKAVPTPGEVPIRMAAFGGALFFAVHPLRAESVAWVTERRDVVSGLFFVLSVLTYLTAQEGGPKRRTWLTASVAFFAASLLAKAMGMMLPIVLLAIDVYPLKRLDPRKPSKDVLLEKVPYFALLVASVVATRLFQGQAGALYSMKQYPPIDIMLQPWYRICFYVWKTIVPFGLSPLYPFRSLTTDFDYRFPLALVVGLAGLASAWIWRSRFPQIVVAAFCYLALISPTAVWQAGPHVTADRYSYLSCIPFAVLFGGIIVSRGRTAGGMVAGVALLGLFMLSWRQAQVWHDSVSLWTRAIEVDPSSPLPYVSRGAARAEKGDLEGAISDFQAALKIDPKHTKAFDNLSKASLLNGDAEKAVTYANQAIESNPTMPSGWFNRGMAKADRRQFAGAAEDFTHALDLSLTERKPTLRPLDILMNRALARIKAGQLEAAESDAERAVSTDRGSARALAIRGSVRIRRRNLDGALEDFSMAKRLDPTQLAPYVARGQARGEAGDSEGALADYCIAVELDPRDASAYQARATVWVERNDLARAISDYDEALRIHPKQSVYWTRRGRLKAKRGDFDGAISDATEALKLDTRNAEALAIRGCSRGDKGDLKGAVEDLELAQRFATPGWSERKAMQEMLDQARRLLKR